MATPEAPSNPILTVLSTSSIRVSWTILDWGTPWYHYIYRSTDGVTYQIANKINGDEYRWTNTGLSSGTLYYYKIRAFGYGDEPSAYSSVVSATTSIAVALAAPTGVTAAPISGTKVEINFTNASVGEDYHVIYRKGAAYAELTRLATGTTYYLDTGLTAGTTYTYKIRDLSGTATYGDYSSEVTATPPVPFGYIAYGTGTTAEGVALTALTTETARAAATVEIVSTYAPNDTVRFSHEFASGGTIAISEVGAFNDASAGTMLGRKLISPVVNATEGQLFMVKHDFIMKDGGCGG